MCHRQLKSNAFNCGSDGSTQILRNISRKPPMGILTAGTVFVYFFLYQWPHTFDAWSADVRIAISWSECDANVFDNWRLQALKTIALKCTNVECRQCLLDSGVGRERLADAIWTSIRLFWRLFFLKSGIFWAAIWRSFMGSILLPLARSCR